MVFHNINQGEHFIYCHLMHVLMSTCDLILFKFSSIGAYVYFKNLTLCARPQHNVPTCDII